MRLVKIYLLLICFSLIAAQCTVGVKTDSALAAILANDVTVILEGCGNQPIVGFTYCRMTEGDAATQSLKIIAPPTKCKDKACVFFTIYYPNAEPAFGDSIPQGETSKLIPWKTLLHRDTFLKDDRGIWGIRLEVHWIDLDGIEQKSFADGEIRLRVLPKDYQALNEIRDEPNFVWLWQDDAHLFKMTSGLRAYVGSLNGNH